VKPLLAFLLVWCDLNLPVYAPQLATDYAEPCARQLEVYCCTVESGCEYDHCGLRVYAGSSQFANREDSAKGESDD